MYSRDLWIYLMYTVIETCGSTWCTVYYSIHLCLGLRMYSRDLWIYLVYNRDWWIYLVYNRDWWIYRVYNRDWWIYSTYMVYRRDGGSTSCIIETGGSTWCIIETGGSTWCIVELYSRPAHLWISLCACYAFITRFLRTFIVSF